MAYSRFGSSCWYTYWYAENTMQFKLPTKKLKYSQIFEVGDEPKYSISYGKIIEFGLERVIEDVKEYYSTPLGEILEVKNPTDKEIEELGRYIIKFVHDIDDYFKYKNFFRLEWYYPIKYKLIFK